MLAFPQPLPASRLYLPQTHPSEHQQVGGKLDCLLLHLERGSFYLFKEQTARSGSSAQRLSSLTSLLSKHFPILPALPLSKASGKLANHTNSLAGQILQWVVWGRAPFYAMEGWTLGGTFGGPSVWMMTVHWFTVTSGF